MIIPGSYTLSLVILVLGMLCWGLWANTFKLAGPKWRFELFYIDFGFGVVISAAVAGLTFGSMGWDGFSLIDDLRIAGKHQELFAFLAGCAFSLSNILFLGAISLTGLTLAFPVTMGMALIAGTLLGLLSGPRPGLLLAAGGCVLILAAVALMALAWRGIAAAQLAAAADPARPKAPKKKSALKGIGVALLAGALLSLFSPLVGMARSGENGLGPYSIGAVFAVGVFLSMLVYDLFFMNLPLQGNPVEIGNYLRGSVRQHLLGLLGGMLWLTGALAALVVARAEGPAQPGPLPACLTAGLSPVIGALCGILVWKELAAAGTREKSLTAVSLCLYIAGVIAISALYRQSPL